MGDGSVNLMLLKFTYQYTEKIVIVAKVHIFVHSDT
jgi:hypothetical protein